MNKQQLIKSLQAELSRYRKIVQESKNRGSNATRDMHRENYCAGRLDGINYTLIQLEQLD